MGELSRENFYAKIATAQRAVQGFFETVIEHFKQRNDIHAHHTDTNGGDLRLALPAELARHHTIRNFTTLYWQSRNQEIFVRSYLTPEEMSVFGFAESLTISMNLSTVSFVWASKIGVIAHRTSSEQVRQRRLK